MKPQEKPTEKPKEKPTTKSQAKSGDREAKSQANSQKPQQSQKLSLKPKPARTGMARRRSGGRLPPEHFKIGRGSEQFPFGAAIALTPPTSDPRHSSAARFPSPPVRRFHRGAPLQFWVKCLWILIGNWGQGDMWGHFGKFR